MKKTLTMITAMAVTLVSVTSCRFVAFNGKKIADALMTESVELSKEEASDLKTVQIPLKEFTELVLRGAFDVDYVVGEPSVTLSAPSKLIEKIKVEQKGKELQVYTNKAIKSWKNVEVVISSRNLESIKVDGAAEIEADLVESLRDFYLQVNGAADVEIDMLKAADVKIQGNGACELDIDNAQCADVDIELNGAGEMKVKGKANNVKVEINGVGSVNVSDLMYTKIKIEKNGLGSVKK